MKKPYAIPTVVTEDALEQTSLACNATQDWDLANNPQVAFAAGIACQIDAGKGNNFATGGNNCEVVVEYETVVALS